MLVFPPPILTWPWKSTEHLPRGEGRMLPLFWLLFPRKTTAGKHPLPFNLFRVLWIFVGLRNTAYYSFITLLKWLCWYFPIIWLAFRKVITNRFHWYTMGPGENMTWNFSWRWEDVDTSVVWIVSKRQCSLWMNEYFWELPSLAPGQLHAFAVYLTS